MMFWATRRACASAAGDRIVQHRIAAPCAFRAATRGRARSAGVSAAEVQIPPMPGWDEDGFQQIVCPAFDIGGTGRADPSSLLAALRAARALSV